MKNPGFDGPKDGGHPILRWRHSFQSWQTFKNMKQEAIRIDMENVCLRWKTKTPGQQPNAPLLTQFPTYKAVESLKTAQRSCEWLFEYEQLPLPALKFLWQASLTSEIIHFSSSTNDLPMQGKTPQSIRFLNAYNSGFLHCHAWSPFRKRNTRNKPTLRIGPRQFASAARVRHSSEQKKPQSPAAHILQNWPEDLGEATGWLMIPVSLKSPENHGFLGNNAQAVSERKEGIHFGHGKCFTFHGAGPLFQWRNHKARFRILCELRLKHVYRYVMIYIIYVFHQCVCFYPTWWRHNG